jgi:membrane-associated phospholipid phosphatase
MTRHIGWRALLITLGAFAVASLGDRWVFSNFFNPTVYDHDWGRLLRVMGFMGTWIAIAAAVGLHEGRDPAERPLARRRAWLLFWAPAFGGAVAELLKIVIRRERPMLHDGAYGFRPWDERTWSGGGLSLPSSHAAVAFAGAAMLARYYPRARWVGYTLAAGCAVTRLSSRAHFLSDVVLAAGIGWLAAFVLAQRWPPERVEQPR